LEKVTGLDLGLNQLTELPKGLENLTQLTRLEIGGNKLTEVPKGLEKLTQLETLSLNNNQLTVRAPNQNPAWIGSGAMPGWRRTTGGTIANAFSGAGYEVSPLRAPH
jgi:hypothetical protein